MYSLDIAGRTRADILSAALNAGKTGAHIAPSLSIVEIMLGILDCYNPGKDTLILSKGHGALGYYAAMHQTGFITSEQLATFEKDGGEFPGQPSRSLMNNIDYSSGSLGMGLSYGVGTAMVRSDCITYVVLGDGELNEGAVWEAASLASQKKLGNLIAVVDQNGLQSDGRCSDILNMDIASIWTAYGWHVSECNGHEIDEIKELIDNRKSEQPTVILARTIKGKGVSFMENNNDWHHRELKTDEYELAMQEIGVSYGFSEKE